ncbi:MAG: hypothetical protein HRU46_04145 [Verrucomicrobiales bacterium]|nr:hypothetical protein [Verrucomicrobiales bacterium]
MTVTDSTAQLMSGDEGAPLFGIHAGDGSIFFYFPLARKLGAARDFYAIEAPQLSDGKELRPFSVEEMAGVYLAELRRLQPSGPYHLCGFCYGGLVAYQMAVELKAAGEQVGLLGLIDADNPAGQIRERSMSERIVSLWDDPSLTSGEKCVRLLRRLGDGLASRIYYEVENFLARLLPTPKKKGKLRLARFRHLCERAWEDYEPPPYNGDVAVFRAIECNDKYELPADYSWGSVVEGKVKMIDIAGSHLSLFRGHHVDQFAKYFEEELVSRDASA